MTDPLACSNSSIRTTNTDLSETSRNVIVNDRWLILGKIGEGSFGEVFEAQDINDGKLYAIKRERKSMRHPQLKRESEHYAALGNRPGIPQCHWYGEFDEFNCIVLDLLGPSLKDVRQCMTPLPFDIIIELIYQMVDIIQHVHQSGLVFRDIKPDNFLFGYACKLPEVKMVKMEREMPHYQYEVANARSVFETWGKRNTQMHIIDLGLATRWRDPDTDKPLPEAKPKRRNKIGTARYASIRVHRGRMHARGDDLEGIAYILLDMVLGTLPWTGIQAKNSAAGWDRMRVMKLDAEMADLLDGYPEGVVKFINYTRELRFSEEPDYDLLKQYLKGALPGGAHSKPTRTPFERTDKSEPRRRHRLAADMTPYSGQTTQQDGWQQHVTDLPPPQDESSGSGSNAKKKWSTQEQRVGWYTYKHDEEPWKPEIDWDPNEAKHNAATASWGEDKADAAWGPKEETGWPSSVARTDSGTGWDCQPSSQETKGDSWGVKPDSNTAWRLDANDNSWRVDTKSSSWATDAGQGWGNEPAKSAPWGSTKPDNSAWPKENDNTKGWGAEPNHTNRGQPLTSTNNRTTNSWGAKLEAKPGTTWESMQNDAKPRSNPQPKPRSEASGSAKWNAWAASTSAKTQSPTSSSNTRTGRHPSSQQTHQASEQQLWATQNADGGWTTPADKDGWNTKVSRHDNRQSQGRGRRKPQQHW
ncbi:kinase-like domain-containing protein [Fennellomyces sp. T-0311]|nr:kinase-like domain-containing protein [Fennellomyces sp. T-0311]